MVHTIVGSKGKSSGTKVLHEFVQPAHPQHSLHLKKAGGYSRGRWEYPVALKSWMQSRLSMPAVKLVIVNESLCAWISGTISVCDETVFREYLKSESPSRTSNVMLSLTALTVSTGTWCQLADDMTAWSDAALSTKFLKIEPRCRESKLMLSAEIWCWSAKERESRPGGIGRW